MVQELFVHRDAPQTPVKKDFSVGSSSRDLGHGPMLVIFLRGGPNVTSIRGINPGHVLKKLIWVSTQK